MTAVVQKACAVAMRDWSLVKITAHVFTIDPASARVLEKCGFVREGVLKKHVQKDGQFLDVWLYALLSL
jgi:RimJ/RimL family protein N-acetyltransferase